jgi:site-specific DNA recombinase
MHVVMIAIAPKPAAAYLRRSTDRQEQSLIDQRREILHWAEKNGYQVVTEYVDDAISGTNAKSRPGFQSMIADAPAGTFKAVIVWNSDRFSRGSVTETEHYRFLLQQAGVSVVSVTEDFLDREDVAGDVLRAVKQFQNRQYSVSLSQNTLRGQISSVLGASDPGRMPPFGYDREIIGPDAGVQFKVRFLQCGDREMYDRHGQLIATYRKGQMLRKPGKDCTARLVLSTPDRVRVVRDIFRWCCEGAGFRTISDRLNRQGMMSPRGKLWQHTTVKALIQNPAYRGDIVWNRRTMSKFYSVAEGRADRLKTSARSGGVEHINKYDWITVPDAVPAIVDRATWDKAQQAAEVRAANDNGRGKQTNRWLLSGVTRCACCGHQYWGVTKRKGHVPGRKAVVKSYYICSGRTKCGWSVCPHPAHISADELEGWVLGELQKFVLADTRGVEEAIEATVRGLRERAGSVDTKPIEKELKQIDATIDALVAGLDPANLALVNDKLTTLRRRRDFLQAQMRAVGATKLAFDEAAVRRWAAERVTLLEDLLKGRRDEMARQAIASYVNEIVIDPGEKTATLAVNAGFGPLGNSNDPQKPNDPPGGGSQVTVIAGVGFEPTTSGL